MSDDESPMLTILEGLRTELSFAAETGVTAISWGQLSQLVDGRAERDSETQEELTPTQGAEVVSPGCKTCPFAGRVVPLKPEGDGSSGLMVVVDGVGSEEASSGLVITGQERQMLGAMLSRVLMVEPRSSRIVNAVRCEGLSARQSAVQACGDLLRLEIAQYRPSWILLMGATALEAMFGDGHSISQQRGTWMDYDGIPVLPTYHPGYLIKRTQMKRLVFDDLKAFRARMDAPPG